MKTKDNIKVIIGGGGTGGHIFPALAIADEIKLQYSNAKIQFVGASNRMEMERVPKAGYPIEGLPVRGFYRKFTLKNIGVMRDYLKCVRKARAIIRDFNPDIVIGVGGYASAPVVRAAAKANIPTLIQEQNSFAGLTNRMLAKKVKKICVAYDGMENYFPEEKIAVTGNPVRPFTISNELKEEAFSYFEMSKEKPVLLVIGGSLGARSVNNAMKKSVRELLQNNIQVIWQTGKYYFEEMKEATKELPTEGFQLVDFISRMDLAYNMADLVVSRAGALSISEICLIGKASVLVPSPNVAEDHQTKNALALVNKGAAKMLIDNEVLEELCDMVIPLMKEKDVLQKLSENALKMAKPNATKDIVEQVKKLIE